MFILGSSFSYDPPKFPGTLGFKYPINLNPTVTRKPTSQSATLDQPPTTTQLASFLSRLKLPSQLLTISQTIFYPKRCQSQPPFHSISKFRSANPDQQIAISNLCQLSRSTLCPKTFSPSKLKSLNSRPRARQLPASSPISFKIVLSSIRQETILNCR